MLRNEECPCYSRKRNRVNSLRTFCYPLSIKRRRRVQIHPGLLGPITHSRIARKAEGNDNPLLSRIAKNRKTQMSNKSVHKRACTNNNTTKNPARASKLKNRTVFMVLRQCQFAFSCSAIVNDRLPPDFWCLGYKSNNADVRFVRRHRPAWPLAPWCDHVFQPS